MKTKWQQKGFTLMELMIVVAIIGIIAAIAIPSYNESTDKTRRRDAQAALMGLASAMERFYTQNSTYAGTAGSGDAPIASLYPSQAPLDGSTKYYNLTITGEDADSYTLSAVPISGGAMDGDRCGTMTMTETGAKGDGDASDNCWQ